MQCYSKQRLADREVQPHMAFVKYGPRASKPQRCSYIQGESGMVYGGVRVYILSRNLSRDGTFSERPLRFLVTATMLDGLLLGSKGSPGSSCQWSNTHCGNA